jgi:hypothetical protein
MSTMTIELSEDQVLRLFEQLSPLAQLAVLKRLILDFDRWEALLDDGAARMRKLCKARGIDWDRLTEDERLQLVDTILHEP